MSASVPARSECLLPAASSTGRRNTSFSYWQGFEVKGLPAAWLDHNPKLQKHD